MSLTIILNSNNVVNNGLNSQFQYNFPVGGLAIPEGSQMAISNVTIPNSWFNINSQYYNNASFQYTFPTSTGQPTFTVFLPNGYYTTTDLNKYLQSIMIANNQYSGECQWTICILFGNGNKYHILLSTVCIIYCTNITTSWIYQPCRYDIPRYSCDTTIHN